MQRLGFRAFRSGFRVVGSGGFIGLLQGVPGLIELPWHSN